jgi:branched-chain amino acid aminotransferase
VKDRIVFFRPEKNAARFADGAEALMMPPMPHDIFLNALQTALQENCDMVPPVGEEGEE